MESMEIGKVCGRGPNSPRVIHHQERRGTTNRSKQVSPRDALQLKLCFKLTASLINVPQS